MSPVGDGSGLGFSNNCFYWTILSAIGDMPEEMAKKRGGKPRFLCDKGFKRLAGGGP
jgi:hypothetical protein